MANAVELAAVEADAKRLAALAADDWARAETAGSAEYRFIARRDWVHHQYASDLAGEQLESLKEQS